MGYGWTMWCSIVHIVATTTHRHMDFKSKCISTSPPVVAHRDHYLRKYTGTTNLDVKLQKLQGCPGQTHLYKKTITHDCCSLFGIGVCKRVLAVSVYQREKRLANFNPLQSHTLCIVRRRLHVPNLVWLMRVCWCTWACMKKLQFRNPQTAPRDKGILFYTVFDPRQPMQQIESVDVETTRLIKWPHNMIRSCPYHAWQGHHLRPTTGSPRNRPRPTNWITCVISTGVVAVTLKRATALLRFASCCPFFADGLRHV